VFEASYTNTFEEPNSFKELLWNIAGPSVGSMIIFLDLLKGNLEAEEVGLPAEFNKIPANLLALLVKEAGKKNGEQIKYIEAILKALDKISKTNSHDEAPSPNKGTNEEASKTQGTLPGAHKASPTEEAAVEPATPAGWDKEGVLTEDDPPWERQPMERECHQLQQTAPPALPDDGALQSEQPLAERT